jgi:hypothetical protein
MTSSAAPIPVDASIADRVSDREYARLLGLPANRAIDGELNALASAARAWYARHARPFAAAVRLNVDRIEPSMIVLESGAALASAALAARLRSGDSRQVAVVAVTAGREVDDESARLWASDRPDAAYFLDRLGAAVAERLVGWTAIAVCRAAGAEQLTALPPLGPGCSDWDMADQATLFESFSTLDHPLTMLESGMMHPKNSMLAVVGLTPHPVHPPDSPQSEACRWCDLTPCTFRRAAFDRSRLPDVRPSVVGVSP